MTDSREKCRKLTVSYHRTPASKNAGFSVSAIWRSLLDYAPGAAFPALSGLAWSMLFTRIFNESEYGKYSLVASTAGLLALVCYRWLEQAIIRYVPEHDDVSRLEDYGRAIVLGCVIASLPLVLAIPLAWFLPSDWRLLSIGGLLLAIFSGAIVPLLAMLAVRFESGLYSKLKVFQSFARIMLPASAVIFIYRDVAMLTWGAALSYALAMVPLVKRLNLPSLRHVLKEANNSQTLVILRQFVEYGVPMSFWFLMANILTVGDRYVLQWFRGAIDVGIYTANYQLVHGTAVVVFSPFALALNPRLMQLWERNEQKEALKLLRKIVVFGALVGLAVVAALFLLAPLVAAVFLGERFRAGAGVMPVIVLGMVIRHLSSYVQKPLEFHERTRELLVYVVIATLVNFIANLLFVPVYGYWGAAWTTVLSYLVYAVLVALGSRRALAM